jgi:uncharacterized protein (TIGR03067 family)
MTSKLMKEYCSLCILVSGLISGCSKSNAPNANDSHKPEAAAAQISDVIILQGKWSGLEAGDKSLGTPSLTLDGTNCEFHGSSLKEWYKAIYSLRDDTRPKQIEALITECPMPEYVGLTIHGIYKLENGALTITVNKAGITEIPTNFDSPQARKLIFALDH